MRPARLERATSWFVAGRRESTRGSGTPLPQCFRASPITRDHSRTPRAATDCLPFVSRSAGPVSCWNAKAGRGMLGAKDSTDAARSVNAVGPSCYRCPLPSLRGTQAARCRVPRVPQSPPAHLRAQTLESPGSGAPPSGVGPAASLRSACSASFLTSGAELTARALSLSTALACSGPSGTATVSRPRP